MWPIKILKTLRSVSEWGIRTAVTTTKLAKLHGPKPLKQQHLSTYGNYQPSNDFFCKLASRQYGNVRRCIIMNCAVQCGVGFQNSKKYETQIRLNVERFGSKFGVLRFEQWWMVIKPTLSIICRCRGCRENASFEGLEKSAALVYAARHLLVSNDSNWAMIVICKWLLTWWVFLVVRQRVTMRLRAVVSSRSFDVRSGPWFNNVREKMCTVG